MASLERSPAAVRGVVSATVCYLLWGAFPIFWKQLAAVDARELIAHRIAWSFVFAGVLASLVGGWGEIWTSLRSVRLCSLNLLSGSLLAINWLVYVWGVNHGHILEMSLGNFLVPLSNVALGCLVLRERLRPAQWLAIACAAAGVGWQLLRVGHLPWIALTLAITFGAYSLLRKCSPLGSLAGLTLEAALLLPAASAYLYWCHREGTGVLGRGSAWQHALVFSTGAVTTIPLILFVYGARRIRLATLGLLQYMSPIVTFLVGVYVYHEKIDGDLLASFAAILVGLALYSIDNLRALARPKPSNA